jgi:hypothetical protein
MFGPAALLLTKTAIEESAPPKSKPFRITLQLLSS